MLRSPMRSPFRTKETGVNSRPLAPRQPQYISSRTIGSNNGNSSDRFHDLRRDRSSSGVSPSQHSLISPTNHLDPNFEDLVDFSGTMQNGVKHGQFSPMFPLAAPFAFSFRSQGPPPQTWAVTACNTVPQTESMAIGMATPNVLLDHVDLSQYEDVPMQDWPMVPTTYDYSSPSSINTPVFSPASTAVESRRDEAYVQHGSSEAAIWGAGMTLPSFFGRDGNTDVHRRSIYDRPRSSISEQHTPANQSAAPYAMEEACDTAVPRYVKMEHVIQPFRPPSIPSPESSSSPRSSHDDASELVRQARKEAREGRAKERRRRDELLLSLRRQGMRYKDIRMAGGFEEAESTLRGRMRMLTKDKAQRVRRPEWKSKDINLLRDAVRLFSASQHGSTKKLPWKKITEWLAANGSSYRFAAATCAKQWDKMNED